MTTSRIDVFKARAGNWTVTESLVGAVMVRRGSKSRAAAFQYANSICEHPDGPYHDCRYVDARNRLIPRAEQAANADPSVIALPGRFARVFMAKMTELCALTTDHATEDPVDRSEMTPELTPVAP